MPWSTGARARMSHVCSMRATGARVHIACVFAACSNMGEGEKDLSIFKPRLTGYHKGTICSQVFFSSPKSGYAPGGVFVVSYFFAQESGV